jgi:transposase-like protein
MPRKPKVQRTAEEKWQIVLEGLKSGNVAETCRKYEIAPTLYYAGRTK